METTEQQVTEFQRLNQPIPSESGRYQYYPLDVSGRVVPGVALTDGKKGVIERIDFYTEGDYLRGQENFSLPIRITEVSRLKKIYGNLNYNMNEFNLWDGLPRALEFFDEKQLKFLSHSFPIEELQELRTFEQSLRKQFGDSYRSKF